jgi:3-dehydroquinate dehydratase / shikimate dehydrogenase
MKYCISICGSTIVETLDQLKIASTKADIIEIRLDKLSEPDLSVFSKFKSIPILLTNRNLSNGGFFAGDEQKRLKVLKEAINFGFDFIDLEYDTDKKELDWFLNNRKKTKIILSYHNFQDTPKNLANIFKKLLAKKPDIIKICTFANKIEDNIPIIKLLENKPKGVDLIIHTMGEKGESSRIMCGLKGNYFTYSSIDSDNRTAPGQISVSKLKSSYRLDRLKNNPKIFGLTGNPVKHSFGYLIHNLAFSKLNFNAVYLNFLVDDLPKFIESFREYYSGLSVTIPFKEKILPLLDHIDPVAAKIGAVNTVINRNNKLYGYNTDAFGIYNALRSKINLKNKTIVVVGNGGSARAALSVLKEETKKIIIIGRDTKKAEKLAIEFGTWFYASLDTISQIGKFDILINTTPVGMFPNISVSPVDKKYVKDCLVFDMIFNPFETKLLKDAKDNGCKTISGFDMFLFQAEAQFKLFTKKEFPFYKQKNNIIKLIKNAY